MVIFAPEVHSFFLRPFVEYTQEQLGDKILEQILIKFGISQKDLSDYTAWISLEFCENFCLEVVKCFNDPNVVDYCARLAISPRYAGIIRPFFRTIGSPMFAYSQIMGATPRFNKVGEYQFEKLGPTNILLTYKYLPGAPKEQSDIVCRARRAQFSALSTMFDIPQANVEHSKCIHRGDEACVYNVTWQKPRRSYINLIAVALSAFLGLLFSYLIYNELSFIFSALGGVTGWFIAQLIEVKHQLSKRNDDLIKQQDALSIVTNTNDRRFEELLEAKNATERTVEERTRELRIATEQLRSLDELKSQFVANISHELRTPLTLSMGPLESVLAEITEGKHRSYLETVYRSQKRLNKLISDLLDFTKLEAGKVELYFTREDIAKILRDLASTIKAAMESRNMNLSIETPSYPVWIYIDRDKFEKITMNLLSNAFKFTPDSGQINIRLIIHENKVTLQVTDSGHGIPQDKLMTIFDRFSQVDASKKRRFSGTGIGLAMVKEYTEMHGGTVTVDSHLEQGSTFSVTFLRGKEHIDPKYTVEDQSATSGLHSSQFVEFEQSREDSKVSELPSPRAPESFDNGETDDQSDKVLLQSFERQARVLIVDDERDIRDYLESLFKDIYLQIYTAKDGLEALKVAQEITPDIILSDMMMPNMSGDELCMAIKNSPGQLGRTPVILLTARAELPAKIAGLQYGVKDYITKPFHPTELQLRVRNILNEHFHERLTSMKNEKLGKVNLKLSKVNSALNIANQKLKEKDEEREHALDLARDFQLSLLPKVELPKNINYHRLFRPAEKVGGDLYDIHVVSPTHVRVFIMDINDHDVHAAFRTATVLAHYHVIKENIPDPGDVLTKLNQIIINTYKGVAFSACCLDIHLQESGGATICYCCSSDIYMYIIRGGKAVEQPTEQFMLGILEDWNFYSTGEVELNHGERLICFTDGIYQQKEPSGECFIDLPAYQETLDKVGKYPTITDAAQSILDACDAFRMNRKQDDDITILGFDLASSP